VPCSRAGICRWARAFTGPSGCDGDGKTDFAVFRPQISSFNVILYRSSATQQTVAINFGNPGDSPLGARYSPAEQVSGLSYSDLPGAQQTLYQNQQGAPHTDKNGRLRTAYDPTVSFFPSCAERELRRRDPHKVSCVYQHLAFVPVKSEFDVT
jgi:hypothetical protein